MAFNRNLSGRDLAVILSALIVALMGYVAWQKFADHFDGINSAEEAQEFLKGTWVYDENTNQADKYPEWERLKITGNGKLMIEKAYPHESKWRDGETKTPKWISEKYANTGVRYFGFTIHENGHEVYIIEGNALVKRLKSTNYNAVFKRGDRDLNS